MNPSSSSTPQQPAARRLPGNFWQTVPWRSVWLPLAPALAYVCIIFLLPISVMFYFSIKGSGFDTMLPQTRVALSGWEGKQLPGDEAYAALVKDLRGAFVSKAIYPVSRELNYQITGFQSAVVNAGRKAQTWPESAGKAELLEASEVWASLDHWKAIKAGMAPLTAYRLLAAVDLKLSPDGSIARAPENQRIYLDFLVRTLWICFVVTVLCLLLGYPLAYAIASFEGRYGKLLLALTLLPFWTSILVRTAAWVIVLKPNGVANGALMALHIVDEPLTMIYNRVGVYIAMTHVLLPFMALPIFSVMKGIPKNLLPAAASLGAKPMTAFFKVYLPQSMPGVAAGVLMTFILALGYYITPALVGGANDQMQSDLIARFALERGNWGMASALGVVLLSIIFVMYAVYLRIAPKRL